MPRISRRQIAAAGLALLGLLSGCRKSSAPSPEPEVAGPPSGRIVLGDVSTDVARKFRKWQPLADYLAANLGQQGIAVGELRVAPDLDSMVGLIRDGGVDLYMDSFYPATYVRVHSGAEPLLLRHKPSATNRCVFFAKAGSGLRAVNELAGRMIAVETRASTSGFLLPLAHLIETGLHPVDKSGPRAPVAPDEVGITFSGDDDNTIQWVISGRVAAGAVDDETYDKFAERNPEAIISLGKTREIIRHQQMLVRPDMSPELSAAVKDLLSGLSQTADGRALLERLNTVAFTEISPPERAALADAREMFDRVEGR